MVTGRVQLFQSKVLLRSHQVAEDMLIEVVILLILKALGVPFNEVHVLPNRKRDSEDVVQEILSLLPDYSLTIA